MNKMFVILLELMEIEHNQVSLRLWPKKKSGNLQEMVSTELIFERREPGDGRE